MAEYFSEPKFSGWRKKVELYLSNYARKSDLKNATVIDTAKFAKKVDFTRLTSNVAN